MPSLPSVRLHRWAIVDASVWVSRFIIADLHHDESRFWLQQHLSGGSRVVSPTLLLVEVAGAIARRTGDTRHAQRTIDLLRATPGLRWVALSGETADQAAVLAAGQRLRGADAVYVALAKRLRIPLITWDNEQLSRSGPAIQALAPNRTT